MTTGWCLGCKHYAYLTGDLCQDCDAMSEGEYEAMVMRHDRARYEAMIEAHLAKAGDDDDGDGQTT